MYRQDFIDNITSWSELLDFCYEYDCSQCEDVEDVDYYRDWINDSLVSWAREDTWRELLGRLQDLDEKDGYDYYVWDDYDGAYRPVDDSDFDEYKGDVLNWGDDRCIWDDTEEDETDEEAEAECEEPADDDNDFQIPDEDLSICDFLTAGVSCIRAIDEEEIALAREQDMVFAEFSKVIVGR